MRRRFFGKNLEKLIDYIFAQKSLWPSLLIECQNRLEAKYDFDSAGVLDLRGFMAPVGGGLRGRADGAVNKVAVFLAPFSLSHATGCVCPILRKTRPAGLFRSFGPGFTSDRRNGLPSFVLASVVFVDSGNVRHADAKDYDVRRSIFRLRF